MNYPLILTLVSCLIYVPSSSADQPVTFDPYVVESANKKYTLTVKRPSRLAKLFGTELSEYPWILQVRQGRRSVWRIGFRHPGFGGGYLANDGSLYVYVSPDYAANINAISIYSSKGCIKRVPYKELNFDRRLIAKSVSYEWAWDDDGYQGFVYARDGTIESFCVTTVDGRLHKIDLRPK